MGLSALCYRSGENEQMFKKTVAATALALAALHSNAAITLAEVPASTVVSRIVGSGIAAFDPKDASNAGTGLGVAAFSEGAASVGFSDGVVLTTGNTDCVRTDTGAPNCTNPSSGAFGSTSSVSFKFNVAEAGTLSFVYVFASEEYENTPAPNPDFAEFLLTGPSGLVDLAKGLPTSVTSVDCSINASQFIDNAGEKCADSGQKRDIEFDGLTTLITVMAPLTKGAYTFEFKISDAGFGHGGPDFLGDSALFIRANSFTFTTPGDPNSVPEPATWALAALGLLASALQRRRPALV
jgi:MYXO-CTERM domain-containing protein